MLTHRCTDKIASITSNPFECVVCVVTKALLSERCKALRGLLLGEVKSRGKPEWEMAVKSHKLSVLAFYWISVSVGVPLHQWCCCLVYCIDARFTTAWKKTLMSQSDRRTNFTWMWTMAKGIECVQEICHELLRGYISSWLNNMNHHDFMHWNKDKLKDILSSFEVLEQYKDSSTRK